MKIKTLTAILILFSTCLSCDKKEDSPPTNTEPPSGSVADGTCVFYVDGVKSNATTTVISLQAVVNQAGKYSMSFNAFTHPDGNIANSVSFSILNDMVIQPIDFVVENKITSNNPVLNYFKTASSVYNNQGCDQSFNGGGIYGQDGEIKITYIDKSTKKISGSFKMNLCISDVDHVFVEGSFTKMDFLLIE